MLIWLLLLIRKNPFKNFLINLNFTKITLNYSRYEENYKSFFKMVSYKTKTKFLEGY